MTVTDRLRDLGITIPWPSAPAANYVPVVRTGNLAFVAGHGPLRPDGSFVLGKLGRELTVDDGYEAAHLTAIQCLASLQNELGTLERVRRIVKLLVLVNCTGDFGQHPQVANGASDLLVALFGDSGRHARSAVGMQALPAGIAVEIEMVVEVETSD
jgi:enamine deaminase RidA (YjgF/YER057c/UK114 family)